MSDEIKREMTGEQEQQGSEPSVDHRGLYNKFRVERRDGKAKHKDCTYFVLDLDHDPHAWPALDAYAEHCKKDRPELAADLRRMTDPNLAGLNYEPIAKRVAPPAPVALPEEEIELLLTDLRNEANVVITPLDPHSARRIVAFVDSLRAALAQRKTSAAS